MYVTNLHASNLLKGEKINFLATGPFAISVSALIKSAKKVATYK